MGMVRTVELGMSNASMTEAEIHERFAQIVAHSVHIDAAQVTPESYLEDLGAESLDLIEISMEVESQFRVWLPEKSILQTAMEIYGPGTLEHEGRLTPQGKALLEARMPPEDASEFQGDVSLKDVQRYFMRISTWDRMIQGLLEYTPTRCAVCNGPLETSLGFRLKCAACGEEVTLKSGDEINREWVQQFSGNAPGSATPVAI